MPPDGRQTARPATCSSGLRKKWAGDELKRHAECKEFNMWTGEVVAMERFAQDARDGKVPMPSNRQPKAEPMTSPLIQSAASLRQKEFAPVRWIVPQYLAEGCTILAGRPKVGKSWLTLDIGLAVAAGSAVLGSKVEQAGDVLCLALEDNERRLKSRIQKIVGPFAEWPERFQYATQWPRADEGGLDQIYAWIDAASDPRLVVVDVLARFRSPHSRSTAQYDADYAAVQNLQAIASEKNVAIIIVHHLRKSASDAGDPFDKVSGTLGLSGGADTVMVLDRDAGAGTVLYGRGRDVEEIETAVDFDKATCRWKVIGAASDVRRSDSRNAIISAIEEGGPLTPVEIGVATDLKPDNVRKLLWKMVRSNDVIKTVGGAYVVTPKNTGNGGNAVTLPMPPLPPA